MFTQYILRSLVLAGAGMLSACAPNFVALDVPQVIDRERGTPTPSTKQITQRIRCELANLADSRKSVRMSSPNDYLVAVQLSLAVQDDGNLAPSFGYTNGVFSFAAGGKVSAARTSTFTADLIYDMARIDDAVKEDRASHGGVLPPESFFACPDPTVGGISGSLGIDTAGLMGMSTDDVNTGDDLGGKGVFGGNVQFVVTKTLGALGPTWAFKHIKSIGGTVNVDETNTDQVTFAFVRAEPLKLFAPPKAGEATPAESKPRPAKRARSPLAPGAPAASQTPAQTAREYINAILLNRLSTGIDQIQLNTK